MKVPHERGPFDIIGDVHGCCKELERLLKKLGYEVAAHHSGQLLSSGPVYHHPQKRKAVFLGDLVDRGPHILDTLRLVYNMAQTGSALCVMGNHDDKLYRKLKGNPVQVKHGLETTMAEIAALSPGIQTRFKHELLAFFKDLADHYVLDEGKLVVAHAGLKEVLQGTVSDHTRAFALYGETTGQKDEYGLPIRGNWPEKYRGDALVVFGHTPVLEPFWVNNAVNIDTGCVFGGRLSALRYPEREIISVVADAVYYQSAKPFPRALQTV